MTVISSVPNSMIQATSTSTLKTTPQPVRRDSDGDNDGSKATALVSKSSTRALDIHA